MLRVEAALARVEGRLGVIPASAAETIAHAAERLRPDPAKLATATARDGVPVPALVAALREAVPAEARGFVHWGATSQDIVDTAMVLAIREALLILEGRLRSLSGALAGLADRHRRTVMPGRTRFQPAVPITFGAKVAGWLAPLLRDLRRLAEMRPRLLVASLGGAAGTSSALGGERRRGRAWTCARARSGRRDRAVACGPRRLCRARFVARAGHRHARQDRRGRHPACPAGDRRARARCGRRLLDHAAEEQSRRPRRCWSRWRASTRPASAR